MVLFCVPRFLLVLEANRSGSYQYISLVMVLSALTPFVLLNRAGRREAGLQKPVRYGMLMYALPAGIAFSLLLYGAGVLLYGDTVQNWYVYIARTYPIPEGIAGQEKLVYFLLFSVPGMLFSPIGEEFFFRGVAHAAMARSWGERRASLADSLAFALTHIAHFGLVYTDGRFRFLFVPALLWVTGMFFASRLFFAFKQATGSLAGAVLAHAGFNLGMTFSIFYLL